MSYHRWAKAAWRRASNAGRLLGGSRETHGFGVAPAVGSGRLQTYPTGFPLCDAIIMGAGASCQARRSKIDGRNGVPPYIVGMRKTRLRPPSVSLQSTFWVTKPPTT
jgi:hypothetical protein